MKGLKGFSVVAGVLTLPLLALSQPSVGAASLAATKWHAVASIGLAPGFVAVVAATEGIDGRAYFLRHCLDSNCVPSDTEVYDAVTNAWTTVGAVPDTRSKDFQLPFGSATGPDGKIYAVGAGGHQDETGEYPSNLLFSYSSETNVAARERLAAGHLISRVNRVQSHPPCRMTPRDA